MQKSTKHFLVIFLSFVLLTAALTDKAYAAGTQEDREEKEWGSYLVTGKIGTSYLFEDVEGDKNLFRSQFSLKKGLNIGQISFRAYRDPEKKAFLDRILLDVRGFGVEPYGRASFNIERRNVFSLSAGYTQRKYFSDVASFANPLFDAGSDNILFRSFHSWNTEENSFDLSGRLRVSPWLKLNAFWNRTKIDGDSLITLRLLNNEFPLDEPVNQTNNVFRLGSEINIKNWLFYSITGIYQKFDLDQTTSSEVDNIGIRGLPGGESSIYLSSQSRQTLVELETWAHEHSLLINPSNWLGIDGSFTSSRTRGNSSGEENIEGRFFWPLYDIVSSAAYLNDGSIRKDLDKVDLAFHFNLTAKLRLNAGYDYYKYSIENTDSMNYSFTRVYYDRTVTGEELSTPLIQLQQDRYFIDANLAISSQFSAAAGYGRTTYKLGLSDQNSEDISYSYKLNSYFGTLSYKISKAFSLKTSLEMGDYNNVFARLIPLKSNSIKIEGQFSATEDISGSIFYKHQKLENSSFSYSSSLDGYGGNLMFKLLSGKLGAVFHYSKNDFNSAVDIIRFVSLFQEIEDVSEYTSDMTYYSGGLWFREGIFKLGAGYSQTKVEGTFPVKIELPYFRAALKLFPGFAFTFNYRYYKHKQNLFKSQNYKANLYNVGISFDF